MSAANRQKKTNLPDTANNDITNLKSSANLSLPIKCIGTVFFSGYSPIAPGTAGSLVAIIPLIIFPDIGWNTLLFLTLFLFFIGVYVSNLFEKKYGEDPQIVVIDEFAGMWTTMLFVPITWYSLTIGFILFRFFDIVKPPPARKLESAKHGWGIMGDDIVAGIYAGIITFIITYII